MNRAALHSLSYGIYIITSGREGRFNGQIANTVIQVTSQPATVAVSINKQNYTHELIEASRRFSVVTLAETAPLPFIGIFGFKCGRDLDKLAGLSVKYGTTGVPIVLDHAVAFIETEVIGQLDCGSHTIFLGRVVEGDVVDSQARPMTYEYYQLSKGGRAPKTAPTYQEGGHPPVPAKAERFKCTICGYIYDPAQGDPQGNAAPGTAFGDLPAEWVCPVCGAGKEKFVPAD